LSSSRVGIRMRLIGSLASAAVAALIGGCGFPDVFRGEGLKDVVITYLGATVLTTGDRVAVAVSVVADGEPLPDPRLRFSTSDNTVLALTPIGDTLVACHSGEAQLLTYFISSMVTDTAPTAVDTIRISGGPPPPTCP